MLLKNLFEDSDQESAFRWIKEHLLFKEEGIRRNQLIKAGDGLYNVKAKDLRIKLDSSEELPFKFNVVKHSGNEGSFQMVGGKTTKGIPNKVEWTLNITGDAKFVDKSECNMLHLWDRESIEGVHKYFSGFHTIGIGPVSTSGFLDILKITGLQFISPLGTGRDPKFMLALDILKRNLGKGRKGILNAQSELIDNDLDDYA